MEMELRHIRYFLAVAEEMNFTRAAKKVGIGQPPLSQQIRSLEEELGAPLFRRVPRGVELTDSGKAFLPEAQTILAQAERAKKIAQRGARGELGSLRLGFTGSAAFTQMVRDAIRVFRKHYPKVELTLEEEDTTTLLEASRANSRCGFYQTGPEQSGRCSGAPPGRRNDDDRFAFGSSIG
jgi:DNA-binding transcriptional LysR family regulator